MKKPPSSVAASAVNLATTHGIVAALGGNKKLAERLNVVGSAISNWHRIGIPRAVEADVLQMGREARVRGLTLTVLREASARAVEGAAGKSARSRPPAKRATLQPQETPPNG